LNLPRRSQLYVPANDEKKIRKSASLPADSIVLDLEDAVPDEGKAEARSRLASRIRDLDWGTRELCVRINKLGKDYSKEDVAAARSLPKINALVLPKAEKVTETVQVGLPLIALIETAFGFVHLEEIVSSRNVSAIAFGPQDFANSVGGSLSAYQNNVALKTSLAITARAYGVDPLDGVYFALNDLKGFRAEALDSRALGFVGKQVVHPSQIEVANEVYSPSLEEIEEAKKIVELYESSAKRSNVGALRVNDKLVDAVHYRKAKALLDKTASTSTR